MKTILKKMLSKVLSLLSKQKMNLTFLDLLREYVAKQISENSLSEGTQRKYEYLISNLELYLKVKRLYSLPADQVRVSHMEALKLWLHQNLKSCSLTHSARHLELCRRALRYAVRMEYIQFNGLEGLCTKRDRTKQVIYLEEVELEKMARHRFESDIYKSVVDLYVFQASTGLSYADLYTYQYLEEREGYNWIYNVRQKSGIGHYVPVFPTAKAIHLKYDGKLPVLTNAAYNRVLKEVAAHVGIKKALTTHTARKTFATLMDQYGVTTATVSRMMGHKSVNVTEKHYISASRKRTEKEISQLFGMA